MTNNLPSRPNLEHLRGQAKALLASLHASSELAAQEFTEYLPSAKGQTPADVLNAGYRLADAQSVIARKTGFASWPALARHVDQLRGLEGTWGFLGLEVDGTSMSSMMYANSKIIMDGDRFGTEGMGGDFEGTFLIDVEAEPHHIEIQFEVGPHAGKSSFGIFELSGSELTLCLGLVGFERPTGFVTTQGSGHALERLKRLGAAGKVETQSDTAARPAVAPVDFSPTPQTMVELHGEWSAIDVTVNGMTLPKSFAASGRRTSTGSSTVVKFGPQTMIDAETRFDPTTNPWQIDYLHRSGESAGQLQQGIARMSDGILETCLGEVGGQRPDDFSSGAGSTRVLSRWRKK